MSTELRAIDGAALSEADRSELDCAIDSLISAHKNNRQEINRLVFESVAAMTTGEDYERQLANKKGLRRFLGGITGSNKKLQDKINSSRAMAQYAAQQTLQRLAEQNLMTFDLIAAVNNKLNASVAAVEGEINQIYAALVTFFKQSRSDMIQLENRVERLEKNVNLLNWQNSIEYQMFNGVEYVDLDDISKLVCLTRDFYDLTKGGWTTSDLLLLKTAMGTIGLSPRTSVNYFDFMKAVVYDERLSQYLLSGKKITQQPEPYLVPLLGMRKLELLGGEERFVVDALAESLEENGVSTNPQNLAERMAKKYVAQEAQVDPNAQVNSYDLVMELLFNLREAEKLGVLSLQDNDESFLPAPAISAEDWVSVGMWAIGKNQEETALTCFQQAVALGSPQGMAELGRCFEFGTGVEEDLGQAVKWYRAAAEAGNGDGACCLGYLYETGEGVEQSWAEAVRWYKAAVEQAWPRAQCNLALCYETGKGVEEDLGRAVELYRQAAEQGYSVGQCNLGYMYETGRGVEQSWTEAVRWYMAAAEQAWPRAQANLGWCYGNGKGVEQSWTEAVRWYKAAAEQGQPSAQVNLGWCYGNGKGVEKDLSKAVEYYQLAAELGDDVGQYDLALSYLDGTGVAVDREKARYWLEKSAKQGYQNAIDRLKREFG